MTVNLLSDVAFVLHRYSYRETSVIVELLTKHDGRVAVIAKGVRSAKSQLKGILQPFISLQIQAKGRSQLKTLTLAEASGAPIILKDKAMFSALYMNELVYRLLPKEEACPHFFLMYHKSLLSLAMGQDVEKTLRFFEKDLLEAIGYGIAFDCVSDGHAPLNAEEKYSYYNEHGFVLAGLASTDEFVFSGSNLLAIAKDDYNSLETLKAAKRLFRMVLAPLLGGKPLKSRELFMAKKLIS
jgi:DNA repair protein RecO (recombination protein O)